MSDDPNDRAARLAGRWESEEEDGSKNDAERDDIGTIQTEELAPESGRERPSDEDDGKLTTREMQSQMLYLPPEFHKELDITFEELNLRFRRERDQKLQKNKDYYAGLLRLGLERLESVRDGDLDEVEELLDL